MAFKLKIMFILFRLGAHSSSILVSKQKSCTMLTGTSTTSMGITQAPSLGNGTSLNRILSFPVLFPHVCLCHTVNKIVGTKSLMDK